MYGVGVERGVVVRFSLANNDAVLAIGKNGAVRDGLNRTLHGLLLRRRRGWRETNKPKLCARPRWRWTFQLGKREITLPIILSTTFNFRVQTLRCQVRQKLHKLPNSGRQRAEKTPLTFLRRRQRPQVHEKNQKIPQTLKPLADRYLRRD
jgi:hypothetical protein